MLKDVYKVVVMVPRNAADSMREAIGDTGGGKIGNYSHCSFSSAGVGRFKPERGSKPTIGSVGSIEEVEEERIEFVVEKEKLYAVLAALIAAHPYEEPAIDLYETKVVLK